MLFHLLSVRIGSAPGELRASAPRRELVRLIKNYLDMQDGGDGILPNPSGGTAIDSVYAQFYDALGTYVTSHGVQGLQGDAVQASGGGIHAIEKACLAPLNTVSVPTVPPPSQRPGFAAG